MKIDRHGDAVRFEYRFENRYIRRVVPLADLTKFLEGGQRQESNLPDGKTPVIFAGFVDEKYLARCAKPNLKSNSYEREEDSAKALKHFFGEHNLHDIDLEMWENYKTGRLYGTLSFSRRRCVSSTVDKEFDCLRRVFNYAVQLSLIKRNPLLGVKGLKNESRQEVWLRKPEIESLLTCAMPYGAVKDLLEFRILTGARPTEALLFSKDNVERDNGEIWLQTLKKRGKRIHKRYFSIKSLGPRFEALLNRIKPHPVTGLYFCQPTGRLFAKIRGAAGVPHVKPYDLRGTFAMHRAMVVRNFRQLQTEMGHSSPMSIQSYLDEASRFRPEDSIFFDSHQQAPTKEIAKTA